MIGVNVVRAIGSGKQQRAKHTVTNGTTRNLQDVSGDTPDRISISPGVVLRGLGALR